MNEGRRETTSNGAVHAHGIRTATARRVAACWAFLTICSACLAGDLFGAWVDQQSFGPFVCRAEFPLNEIQPLVAQLPQLQESLSAALGIPAAQESIELYLFRNKGTYDQYLSRNLPKVTYRRALYIKDGGPGREGAEEPQRLQPQDRLRGRLSRHRPDLQPKSRRPGGRRAGDASHFDEVVHREPLGGEFADREGRPFDGQRRNDRSEMDHAIHILHGGFQ